MVGRTLEGITGDFAGFWRSLVSEGQLRWLGPEKGVMHISTAAVVNAVWDLWAKTRGVPVWRLLADLSPEEIVSTVDFRYISDAIAPDEAIDLLRRVAPGREERERALRDRGYAAYTTSAGWLGYDDEKVEQLVRRALAEGFRHVKMKVGQDLGVRRPPRRPDPRRARRFRRRS